MLTQNTIAFRKGMILVPVFGGQCETEASGATPKQIASTLLAELMQLGYMLDEKALDALLYAPKGWVASYYNEIIAYVKKTLGADRAYTPFYRNFPTQVMEMSHLELFLNAVLHYWSNGRWEPPQAVAERGIHFENTDFKIIKLGTPEEFKGIFTKLVSINQSLTEDDKEIVAWFLDNYGGENLTLPERIPFKETLCILAAKRLDVPVKDTTDVLRIAVYMSGGDISLPNVPTLRTDYKGRSYQLQAIKQARKDARDKFKFKHFTRSERRYLIGLLAKTNLDVTDMQRRCGRWLRLAFYLNPGEYATKYPKVADAFRQLREQPTGEKSAFTGQDRVQLRTFNSDVDRAFAQDFRAGADLLATRPGEFARRLDWMLRPAKTAKEPSRKPQGSMILGDLVGKYPDPEAETKVALAPAALSHAERMEYALDTFYTIGHKVSGKVLFEMYTHFQNRLKEGAPRTIRMKSKRAKVKHLPPLEALPPEIVASVQTKIMEILHDKIADQPRMGKVWVDERLKDVPLPFSMRSVNTSIKTYVRGTRIPFRADAKVIRAFIHWHDENGHEDLDLSVGLYNGSLQGVGHISFTGLKDMGCCHSGDIRHRRGPCAEYVDIPVETAMSHGVRYAVVQVYNFNGRPLHSVKDTVFGLMERENAVANEIFVPKTISNCMGLANEGTSCVVCIIDLENRNYIWADTEADRSLPTLENAAGATAELLRSLILGTKMSVYDLLSVHAKARGEQVQTKAEADVAIDWDDMVTDYAKVAQYMNV